MTSFFRFALLFLATISLSDATDKKALPVAPKPAPVAIPAFVDAVTFDFKSEGEQHKITVISAPTLLRVDDLTDGYSIIFDPATEHYTGLEHRNYTWWEFSWPQVREAAENSKQHAARLQDLSMQGLNSDNPSPSTNAPASSSTDDDDSGYVWRTTNDHKKIGELDCVRWSGETVSGDSVDAWCCATPLPKVQAAIDRLRLIDEPMALVAIRTVAPDFIFPVFHALAKGGVTPVLITWGDRQNRNSFRLVDTATRDGKATLFTIPKLYMKTTLISMDGMIDSQPATGPRKSEKLPKTWQN